MKLDGKQPPISLVALMELEMEGEMRAYRTIGDKVFPKPKITGGRVIIIGTASEMKRDFDFRSLWNK